MAKGNIVITGVSTGIGYHCAKKFCDEGYRVFGSVRKRSDAERVKADFGDRFEPLLFDVTNHTAIRKGADEVSNQVGEDGVALLINNAGIAVSGPTSFLDVEDYKFQFEVNFFGLIAVTKAFLPLLGAIDECAHSPGKIINISSVSGELSYPFLGPYAASKHAVEGFSKSLRRELLLYGVDVIVVGPGAIKTPIWNKVEEVPAEIQQSAYGPILEKFKKGMLKEVEEAMEVELLAHKMFDIFIDHRPKTRYSILKRKFLKWTLPRYFLPARTVDKYLKKMLEM